LLCWPRLGGGAALVIALVCLPGFFAARAQAKAGPPIESLQTSSTLTKLAADARSLLNQNLPTPKLDIRIEIGYATTPHQGEQSPVDTFPATSTETGRGKQTVTRVCEIVVDRPAWDASYFTGGYDGTGKGDRDRALELVTHEEFHCYQLQLLGDPAFNKVPDWVKEGLPRWVDLSLFPANPVPSAAEDLGDYFKNPTTPLFTRKYDAVGFWSHLADVTHGFWHQIPKIILASAQSNEATVNAALEGVTNEQFFDSWGSSAANPPDGDAAWTAESPFPPRDPYASAPRTINIAGAPNTQVSVPLDPYSTLPIRIDPPAAPAGEIETVRIDLDGAYGRFGVKTNYTGAALTDKTFCADATSCPTIKPASGSCPAANSPPTLTPLPADALLGLAAARNPETVKINYASVPMTATCTPACNGSSAHADSFHTAPTSAPPPGDVLLGGSERPQWRALKDVFAPLVAGPQNYASAAQAGDECGGDGGTASTFGDPHLSDFAGNLFDFQQAGEFTLLKSTQDDFQVQIRQQPLGYCCVAWNTAVAMRVGLNTIEVDTPNSVGSPWFQDGALVMYVNKRRVHGSHVALRGGGSLRVKREFGSPTPTVSWPDGSSVIVQPMLGDVLAVSVQLAAHRLGHVVGLLGNSGVPGSAEFVSRNGRHYPHGAFTGSTTRDLRILYREFGASWRITQRESLFRYARGKSTRSYIVRGFPSKRESLSRLLAKLRARAEKACRAAGITNTQLFDACVLDVGATGQKRFAAADAKVQSFVGPGVGWTKLSGAPENAFAAFAPSLAFSAGKVLAAYANVTDTGIEVASFAPTPGTPTSGTRTTALSSWQLLSSPILLPAAGGGQQLMFSGVDSGAAGQPSGTYLIARQADGSFAAPTAIDPDGPLASGALLASDGKTPLWATDAPVLSSGPGVEDGATNPPTDNDLSSFSPPGSTADGATLARDSSGRLWIAWYANTLSQSSSFILLLQLDPETGAPLPGARAQQVPQSNTSLNQAQIVLGCNTICHVVYTPQSAAKTLATLVSWAPGQTAPITVANASPGGAVDFPVAAAAPDGRLWIAYTNAPHINNYETVAKLGDDNGGGGTPTTIPAPPKAGTPAFGAALVVPAGLVVAQNWYTKKSAAIWATVVPQP
jgi:hypothetical protein